MKKLLPVGLIVFAPLSAFATETSNTQPYTPRFFIEYGVEAFTSSNTTVKIDGYKAMDADLTELNGGGFLSAGIDVNGVQISLSPSYSHGEDTSMTEIDVRLEVPFLTGNWQPYIALSGGIVWYNEDIDDDYDISETAFAYGIGAGVKYSFNDNMFIKLGLDYQSLSIDTKIYGYNADIDMSSFVIRTGLGYRF